MLWFREGADYKDSSSESSGIIEEKERLDTSLKTLDSFIDKWHLWW